MTLKLNREFAVRYSLVALLFLGMGGWFAFDGFVRYPRTPAAELYRSIEKAEVPEDMSPAALEAFKRQKTASQKGLALVLTVAAAWVGLLLARAAAFRFDYDEKGFVCARGRYEWSAVKAVDRRAWKRKGILRLELPGGGRLVLDGWHHVLGGDVVARLAALPAAKEG